MRLPLVTQLGSELDKKYLVKVIQLYSMTDEDISIFKLQNSYSICGIMLSVSYWGKNWDRNRYSMKNIFKINKASVYLCNILLALEHILTLIITLATQALDSLRVSAAHWNHQWLRKQRNVCSSASALSILNYVSATSFSDKSFWDWQVPFFSIVWSFYRVP